MQNRTCLAVPALQLVFVGDVGLDGTNSTDAEGEETTARAPQPALVTVRNKWMQLIRCTCDLPDPGQSEVV